MMPRVYPALVWLSWCVGAVACGADAPPAVVDAAVPVPPSVAKANDVVGMTVGTIVAYDATQGGATFSDASNRGLTYSIALAGDAAGLVTTGGVIGGSPTTAGVIVATITATDAKGSTAIDRFPIVIFAGDVQTPKLAATLARYADAAVPLPTHFTTAIGGSSVVAADNATAANPITDAGATLGRVLFYDPRLSKGDVTPCSSCHIQSLGFSDALQFSVGFDGGITGRHSPGLANARFYRSGKFFWDERAATLEDQVLGPIQNRVEMGMSLDTLMLKLRATPYYPALFAAAFGSNTITSDRVARALSQFVRSLTSYGSRYDAAFDASGTANFARTLSAEEQEGEQVFRTAGCAQCHTTVAQIGDAAHNIGLDAVNLDVGIGNGAVKVPSLRNVAVRPRFMHDGRFATLAEVVDFFDAGVRANPDLDPRLKAADGTPRRLGLTAAQKTSLVAFMKTLTDSAFLSDARFTDPFAAVVPPPPPPPPPPPTSTAPLSVAISIQGNSYRPPTVTVAKGGTISYTNLDNRRHSAKFFSSDIVSTPIFTSGTMTVKMPATAGTYPFQCAVHGAAMSGTIIVQ